MKKMGEILLSKEPFSEIVMGNTALVRAFVEAGAEVVTSYPGSPTPEIAAAIGEIPESDRPFYFEFSTNEKVATEIALGASLAGRHSVVFFKSVGLNVAMDAIIQTSLMELKGGLVIVLGDDPGYHSSQNEQDNRHFARMSYMPVFEPATPTETYEMFLKASELSKSKQMPVILRTTTHTCHQKELVSFSGWNGKAENMEVGFNRDLGPFVPITSNLYGMKKRAIEKLLAVGELTDNSKINPVEGGGSRHGIITSGTTVLSAHDALLETDEKPDILKLGVTHPIPKEIITKFLKDHREVLILEELDDILEKEIKSLAFDRNINVTILSREGADEFIGEHTPDKVRSIIHRVWPGVAAEPPSVSTSSDIPPRPPQMCPGCGHRSAFYAVGKALSNEDIRIADIGCHSLGFIAPYNMGDVLVCMGASTGVASGITLAGEKRKVVAFIGDSTFYHAGIPAVVNALFNHHNVTLIVMENGTTAMTGHQNHPGTGRNFDTETAKMPIRNILENLGVENIYETDTYIQKDLTEMTKEALSQDGLSVVIAKHPCMLKWTREQRKKGWKPVPVNIDQEKCTKINECISTFACPSFNRKYDGTISVNRDLCIGDGSCIRTCPKSAIEIGGKDETV